MDLTRSIRKELKQIREVRHENLVHFVGAVVEPGAIFIVTTYCARGSLQDILRNNDLRLDTMFVSSLIGDLLRVRNSTRGIYPAAKYSARVALLIICSRRHFRE